MTTRCQTPSRNLHPQRLLLAGVTLALAYATLPASAQTGAPQATQQLRAVPPAPRQPNYVMLDAKPVADSEEPSEATPSDANHVGLKLHGHWVVDVLNPDHSLAHHHAFDNSLQLTGQILLLTLLGGYDVAGNPEIFLANTTTNNGSPCLPPGGPAGTDACLIVVSTSTEPGKYDCGNTANNTCAAGLTMTYNSATYTNSPPYTVITPPELVLVGNITANQDGSITTVSTNWWVCSSSTQIVGISAPSTVSPATCQAATGTTNEIGDLGFSATSPSPIAVAAGQIMQVTITFTIS